MSLIPKTLKRIVLAVVAVAATYALLRLGKPPPPAGGPPEDFFVSAVVAPVSAETVSDTVAVVGSLEARDTVEVLSEVAANVVEILFTEGDPVRKGDVLVRLDDAKLSARLAEARARRNLAETNFKRAEDLLASDTISQAEHDQVKAEYDVAVAGYNLLKRELDDTVLKAPFDGIMGARLVSPGQLVSIGQRLTSIVRLDVLEASFRIPERHVGQIRNGQPVIMDTVARPGEPIRGEVFFVDPVIDSRTRSVLAKARVDNTDLLLRPGMFGTLLVVLSERENALVVPESAVRYAGEQASVVVMNGENRAEFRNVTVGQRQPGRVEITSGLTAGEVVVVEGYQKMGPGTGITISPASERYGISPPPPPETPAAPEAAPQE
jgi:membrane fusion protein (multidrug efflux system)